MLLVVLRVKVVGKVIQISVLTRIEGNVNADEVIGTRITIKKMYSPIGEVLPFVSARAIKYSIRQALKERGYEIDQFQVEKIRKERRLKDSGDPERFIDNDLFGYMVPVREELANRRQAPVALSYLKALRDTPIKTDFAGRFPREETKGESPLPYEIEVADFIGRLNCIIYDYVGDFTKDIIIEKESKIHGKVLPLDERRKRLRDFLEIFLTPSYTLPRRTNSLNIPEYHVALVTLSRLGVVPVFQYLDYDFERKTLNEEKLNLMVSRADISRKIADKNLEFLIVDYHGIVNELPSNITKVSVDEAVEKILKFYFE